MASASAANWLPSTMGHSLGWTAGSLMPRHGERQSSSASTAYEVQAALIGAGSALLGGIVGTIGTFTAGRWQHERDMTAALKAEGRTRAREAALALQDLVDVLDGRTKCVHTIGLTITKPAGRSHTRSPVICDGC